MREYRACNSSEAVDQRGRLPEGDALLTNEAGLLLSIRIADCLPILLVTPRQRAVAAIHAGWRGALQSAIEKAALEMSHVFECRPRELLAAVGPSIRVCCYEVGEEVLDAFRQRMAKAERFFPRVQREGQSVARLHLDLVALARNQLKSAGVPRSHIDVAPFCTACRRDLFFSHRKEGSDTGRMMAVIGIRPPNGK